MVKSDFDFVSIQLKPEKDLPLYVQLYQQLADLIRAGKIVENYRLPAIRKLAQSLEVNPGTVVNAYKELEKNGFIYSKLGSGSYVAKQEQLSESFNLPLGVTEVDDNQADYLDLTTVSLSPDLVSVKDFQTAIDQVLKTAGSYAFSAQESQGYYPLRQALCSELAKSSIYTAPQNVQIISGAQQGIDIIARTLLKHGDTVLVENPTYPGALAAFRACGAKIIDVKMTADGMDMEEAETKIRLYRPKLIYTMPNVQNPTGITYSKEKKRKLLGLARHYGAYILEDDSLSGLYYQSENTKPIKTYDQDERVIYILSLSKLFMPGLRLGYLLVPTELLARVRTIKHLADIATSGLIQRVYDYYLRNGLWSKHLTTLKESYQQRFEYCQQLLEKQLGKQVSYQLPQGGLTFWLKLPAKVSAKMVAQKAKKQGVLVTPGQVFYARQADDSHLRISFAGVDEQQAKEALIILGQIIKAE
ncbi:PLP-dependent aminotransferase family protein [Ligilactobacillus agilis]|uniref:MocR-like pyridoxine biosynthesis transcription factor PdxR n=1 Tax=Ligilactobacillus agilis TaxID=1601 RepID=UPI000B8D93C6|nr:PLP-dependent aminotransferase family protein [Ligilactobacillus agilis]ASR41621.1 GntR family transcriptional regulator [Ligilactobacillus agilis]GET14652.1 GntR family transcriptional regulator [Ligilactobacillus agilis]